MNNSARKSIFLYALIGLVVVWLMSYIAPFAEFNSFLAVVRGGTLSESSDWPEIINVILGIAILSTAAVGFFQARCLACRYESEYQSAKQTANKCKALLAEIRDGSGPVLSPEELSRQYQSVGLQSRSVERIFNIIVEEARNNRSSPASILLSQFRSEMSDYLVPIVHKQRLCLQLGILGTFLGMLICITAIDADDLLELAPQAINGLFSGMQTAFVTSIWGLLASIFLTYCSGALQKSIRALLTQVESLLTDSISVGRNLVGRDALVDELTDMRDRLDISNRHLELLTDQFRKTVDLLGKLKAPQEDLRQGLERLSGSISASVQAVIDKLNAMPGEIAHSQQAVQTELQKIQASTSVTSEKILEHLSKIQQIKVEEDYFRKSLSIVQEMLEATARAERESALAKNLDESLANARDSTLKNLLEELQQTNQLLKRPRLFWWITLKKYMTQCFIFLFNRGKIYDRNSWHYNGNFRKSRRKN